MKLPFSLTVLLENLKRNYDGENITDEQISAIENWRGGSESGEVQKEIQFTPERVIMQDFTGVPCVVDFASIRDQVSALGGDEEKVNPMKKVQLVIDHSVQIDFAGEKSAIEKNMDREFERNKERYQFLKWGASSLKNFEVVPPGQGIIHQVNVEKLATVVDSDEKGSFFDTCVGTDSHTTMVNGLGVLGWGVGGIEAEAAALGQPIPMLIPDVIGVKIKGRANDNVFATDIVLTLTQLLREEGVVGKFVEFFGDGIKNMDVPTRTTLSNMCPEFGATAAVFPIDSLTLDYLSLTGRSQKHVDEVEKFTKEKGVFGGADDQTIFSKVIEFDLSKIEPSIAGPKRPQDRIPLKNAKTAFEKDVQLYAADSNSKGESKSLKNGDIVIASITSCTNTSNPEVLIAAGLIAKKAVELGLSPKKHVRCSFAPGSKAVSSYLKSANLLDPLEKLGFNIVGFGCATCIGNSGPNPHEISQEIQENELAVAAILSGNRNFEGRINPDVKMNYLASPPLVVLFALAGTINFDPEKDSLGVDKNGNEVFFSDLIPKHSEIEEIANRHVKKEVFENSYSSLFEGDFRWKQIKAKSGNLYSWETNSTYIQPAPFFDSCDLEKSRGHANIENSRVLLKLGNSVTTDHISPAGTIPKNSPAGLFLTEKGVGASEFNSYGSRRGNSDVMVRGTFANIRIQNQLNGVTKQGGWTFDFIDGCEKTVFDASVNYSKNKTPLIVIAGKEYGTGSSRDWAAKGTKMLGVKAVIAQSFERIHRSNLIGMGVLPLQFLEGESAESLQIDGSETFSIVGVDQIGQSGSPKNLKVTAKKENGDELSFEVTLRIDTPREREYFLSGGILPFVAKALSS